MMKLLPDQSGLREREIFDYRVWLTPLLLMTMLVGISSFNYLLFHVLIELFAVVVSLLMFVVSYQTRRFSHFAMVPTSRREGSKLALGMCVLSCFPLSPFSHL